MSRRNSFSRLTAQRRRGKACRNPSWITSPYARRLAIEHLEDRRLLAVITVDSLLDNFNPSSPTTDGAITIREAILAANADTPIGDAPAGSGPDTIDFSITGTINLDAALGQLDITTELAVLGPGAALLTIDAGNGDDGITSTGDGFRIFNINDGSDFNHIAVEIMGLTLTGGDSRGLGGAIQSHESLLLHHSVISGNSTFGSDGSDAHGGGIAIINPSSVTSSIFATTISHNSSQHDGGGIFFINSGTFTINGSTISGNSTSSTFADGGGINGHNYSGLFTISDSIISGNSVNGNNSNGGGVRLFDSSTSVSVIRDSTISGNFAENFGGGVMLRGRYFSISSSTVSGNVSGGDGGGMYLNSAIDVHIVRATITNNSVSSGSGGGVHLRGLADVTIDQTIVAKNTSASTPDVRLGSGTLSVNYSLIGTGVTPDTGTSGNNVFTDDPMLGPLFNNGGPTPTHLPLAGSPALDHIPPSAIPLTGDDAEFDQRGMPFLRLHGANRDIGAVELQPNTGGGDADFDSDGDRDGIDFLVWQSGFGTTVGAAQADGDATNDGDVDAADLIAWETTLGSPRSSADFDLDGDRDGLDFLAWQSGFGMASTAYPGHGDANHDGSVTSGDLATWEAEFGSSVVKLSAASGQLSALQLPQAATTGAQGPTRDIRADLIDAALAMVLLNRSTDGEEAVPVEPQQSVEAIFDSTFERNDPAPTSDLSSFRTSKITNLANAEEAIVEWFSDGAVNEVFDRVFG